MLSFTGILIEDTVDFNAIDEIPDEPNLDEIRYILNISIFDFVRITRSLLRGIKVE